MFNEVSSILSIGVLKYLIVSAQNYKKKKKKKRLNGTYKREWLLRLDVIVNQRRITECHGEMSMVVL